MVKPRVFLPVFVAGSVALAEVFGPHEPHVEVNPETEVPRLVGMLAQTAMSTATISVMGTSVLGWQDFR